MRGVFVDICIKQRHEEDDVVGLGGEKRVEKVDVMRLPVAGDEDFRFFDVILETGRHVSRIPDDGYQRQDHDEELRMEGKERERKGGRGRRGRKNRGKKRERKVGTGRWGEEEEGEE